MGGLTVLFAVCVMLLAALFAADWYAGMETSRPQNAACVAVFPLKKDAEQLEAALRWAYGALQSDFDGYGTLCLIDAGASEEALKIASAFCRGHSGAMVTSEENLRAILGDAVYKTMQIVLY